MEKLGKNVFIFSFERTQDRLCVLRSGPWYFDKFFMVIEMMDAVVQPSDMQFHRASFWVHFFDLPLCCMNVAMARQLGNAVGTFENVDCDSMGRCWGSSLRVRIFLDISKPLRREIKLNIDGPIGGCWIPMQYEKLP